MCSNLRDATHFLYAIPKFIADSSAVSLLFSRPTGRERPL